MQSATGCLKKRSLTAARTDTSWDSVPLCSRAAKTGGIRMNVLQTLSLLSVPAGRTAPSRSPSASVPGRVTASSGKRARTATCSGMRHMTAATISGSHPPALSAAHRQECLWDLKELGYQVGTGFMVGSPFQTSENLADDMLFLTELNPQMVGIGPFIPHHDTPFADQPAGTLELTLFMLGLIRLLLPKVLLPATTALGTIAPDGREQGILAGANVVMPNLSPAQVREKYLLYDNKLCTGSEAAESLKDLEERMAAIGYHVTVSRGDSLNI